MYTEPTALLATKDTAVAVFLESNQIIVGTNVEVNCKINFSAHLPSQVQLTIFDTRVEDLTNQLLANKNLSSQMFVPPVCRDGQN